MWAPLTFRSLCLCTSLHKPVSLLGNIERLDIQGKEGFGNGYPGLALQVLNCCVSLVLLHAGAQNAVWQQGQERAVFPLPASWEAARIAGKLLTREMALRAVTLTGAHHHI
jgi:hypothetical protein